MKTFIDKYIICRKLDYILVDEVLTINGVLNLIYDDISELPENLVVNGDLYIFNTAITRLPESLVVNGKVSFDLGTQLTGVSHYKEGCGDSGDRIMYAVAVGKNINSVFGEFSGSFYAFCEYIRESSYTREVQDSLIEDMQECVTTVFNKINK